MGRIGFLLALRARALGMHILAHDLYLNPDSVAATESGAELVTLRETLRRLTATALDQSGRTES